MDGVRREKSIRDEDCCMFVGDCTRLFVRVRGFLLWEDHCFDTALEPEVRSSIDSGAMDSGLLVFSGGSGGGGGNCTGDDFDEVG